jgi:GAF domain-containing protein
MSLQPPRWITALSGIEFIVTQFSKNEAPHPALDAALDFITMELGADLAEIWKAAPGNGLVLIGSRGTVPVDATSYQHLGHDSNPYQVYRTAEILIVNDPEREVEVALKNYSRGVFAESFAYIPLKAGGKSLGVLGVASGSRNFFKSETTALLKLLAVCLGCMMNTPGSQV